MEPAAKARQRSAIAKQNVVTYLDPRNFGCDVSVRPPARTDSGGGGGESQDDPTRGGECHLFLAGNGAVLLGNRRLSWRETA